MEIILSGKTLDDFKNFVFIPDKIVSDFYDKLTVSVFPGPFEEQIEPHKYFSSGNNVKQSFLLFRDYLIKMEFYENYSMKKILDTFNRFKNFVLNNKLTKSFEAFLDNEALVIEYQGLYSNIHFEYSKNIVALLGFIGLQVQEILYQDKYCRFRFIVTPLTKSKKLNFKERGNLANNNEQKFFNSLEMLDDKRYHLWIKLSKDKNCIVSFLDYNSGKNFNINSFNQVNKLSKEKNASKKSFTHRNLLKIFEQLNWITIIEIDSLIFKINISKAVHPNEYKLLFEMLTFTGIVAKRNGYFI
ncbi:hypothetical protein LCGC14_2252370, partial [marine sediment metagenome]